MFSTKPSGLAVVKESQLLRTEEKPSTIPYTGDRIVVVKEKGSERTKRLATLVQLQIDQDTGYSRTYRTIKTKRELPKLKAVVQFDNSNTTDTVPYSTLTLATTLTFKVAVGYDLRNIDA